MHKHLKRALGAGILGGIGYAAWRAWSARTADPARGVEWSTAPFPFPPVPRSTPEPVTTPAAPSAGPPARSSARPPARPPARRAPAHAWVEPNPDGSCPATHPIKAKLASGIYHRPGGANYTRTKPDRCYVDEAAAEADGLRASKV
jgi:hypothetical protein